MPFFKRGREFNEDLMVYNKKCGWKTKLHWVNGNISLHFRVIKFFIAEAYTH
jgi:hypothetical protein